MKRERERERKREKVGRTARASRATRRAVQSEQTRTLVALSRATNSTRHASRLALSLASPPSPLPPPPASPLSLRNRRRAKSDVRRGPPTGSPSPVAKSFRPRRVARESGAAPSATAAKPGANASKLVFGAHVPQYTPPQILRTGKRYTYIIESDSKYSYEEKTAERLFHRKCKRTCSSAAQ